VILDTTVLVDMERSGSLTDQVADGEDVAVAAVTIAEYAAGVCAARRLGNGKAESTRSRVLDDVSRRALVLQYTRQTAAEHAELLDHCRAAGKPRGAHDLIIAAHARETGRAIVSTDAKARFADLPGVTVR
jgi:predicted nucleic acid-binding protein